MDRKQPTTPKSLKLAEFEAMCDDPARDAPGGVNMQAVLIFVPERGFFLSAQDGQERLVVTDSEGKQIRFRTIEGAMSVLRGMHGLAGEIILIHAKSWLEHD